MNDREKIVDRIRKLRLKADDGAVGAEEAAVFAQKASKIMEEYMVTDDELAKAEGREVGVDGYVYDMPGMSEGRISLIGGIGSMFSVASVYNGSFMGDKIALVGRRMNCDAVYEVYQRILKDILDEADRLFPNKIARDRYSQGLMYGVARRCLNMRVPGADSNLPMVVEMKKVEEFLEQNGIKKEVKSVEPQSIEEYFGMMNADMIEIHKTVDK